MKLTASRSSSWRPDGPGVTQITVIDSEGRIERIFRKVKPKEHVDLLWQLTNGNDSTKMRSVSSLKRKRDSMLKK